MNTHWQQAPGTWNGAWTHFMQDPYASFAPAPSGYSPYGWYGRMGAAPDLQVPGAVVVQHLPPQDDVNWKQMIVGAVVGAVVFIMVGKVLR